MKQWTIVKVSVLIVALLAWQIYILLLITGPFFITPFLTALWWLTLIRCTVPIIGNFRQQPGIWHPLWLCVLAILLGLGRIYLVQARPAGNIQLEAVRTVNGVPGQESLLLYDNGTYRYVSHQKTFKGDYELNEKSICLTGPRLVIFHVSHKKDYQFVLKGSEESMDVLFCALPGLPLILREK